MKTCIADKNYDREVKSPCGIIASHILTFHTGNQSALCENHDKYANEKLGKKFIIKQKAIEISNQ